MDALAGYPESPMDMDDAIYPCKGCGEVLEEGKAFELAGNRWHIDCFRCNTCGTLLDSDANLLLLGDGSLICNNCTYSCSVCSNKIEDLAILTGDQAFCANCFRCRNCKKKIENLKYARTSQGIFCMECHESLMQRRRKKTHKSGSNRLKQPAPEKAPHMLLDKSLPSLPPSAVDRNVLAPEPVDSPSSEAYSDTTELASSQPRRPSNARSRSDHGTPDVSHTQQTGPRFARSHSTTSEQRDRTGSRDDDHKENLAPSHRDNHAHNRHSSHSDASGTGEDFFIPMKLDTGEVPAPSPTAAKRDMVDLRGPPGSDVRQTSRDHGNSRTIPARKPVGDHDSGLKLPAGDATTGSRNSSQPNSPHIAYQERGRQMSSDLGNDQGLRRKKEHAPNNSISSFVNSSLRDTSNSDTKPRRNGDGQQAGKFMLQEAPKSKKNERPGGKSDTQSPPMDTSEFAQTKTSPQSASVTPHIKEQHVLVSSQDTPDSATTDVTLSASPRDPQDSHGASLGSQLKNVPERGDSLAPKTTQALTPAKRVAEALAASKVIGPLGASDSKPESGPPGPQTFPASGLPASTSSTSILPHRGLPRPGDVPSTNIANDELPHPPQRAKERLAMQSEDTSADAHTHPRAAPQSMASNDRIRNDSGLRNGEFPASPQLPRYNDRGEVFVDTDSGRDHDEQLDSSGFLRRVSKSVRHARSYSDRSGVRSSREQPKWPKSPKVALQSPGLTPDLNSPTANSPEANREQMDWLKSELRKERQKTLEREQHISELEQALDAKSSIKQMNSELREKRSTMVVLDTQKELVVRELEVLTDHIAAVKSSGEPLDVSKMTNGVLREFAQSLQELKDEFRPHIEDLTQRKNDLFDEIADLNQQKERALQELEQFSAKNTQLADLNNQLVHQIQELHRANQGTGVEMPRPANSVGVYQPQHHKDRSIALSDYGSNGGKEHRPSVVESYLTGSTVVQHDDLEPATYLSAPQVVNIRKAQPKKFNWKKGGQNVAKGVTKGLKGAFSSDARGQREGSFGTEGMPYGTMTQQDHPRTDSYSKGGAVLGQADRGPGFGGFFGDRKGRPQQWKNSPNHSHSAVNGDGIPPLFGSELEIRAEYERSNIPGVVMRCIQEVDARGIDLEGIYRKSGGTGQVQVIKEGFERNNDYDISDPDLDINAVTSTLKQYFRKLPTPLITYDVYNKLLETTTLGASGAADIDPSHPAHPHNPNNHGYRIAAMRHAINELPSHHRDTLEVLVFHLARVIEHERDNLMTSLNVAVVFAPTIMRPESLAREMQDTQAKNAAVQFLIENCQAVFTTDGGPTNGVGGTTNIHHGGTNMNNHTNPSTSASYTGGGPSSIDGAGGGGGRTGDRSD